MTTPNIITHQKKIQAFPVVGIGGTASGMNAFKKIISVIPPDSGMAYVIVIHGSPEWTGSLSELLSPSASLPVNEIINDINLIPNHIYIIPENTLVIAENDILQLKQRNRGERRNNSIDIFFESLAAVYKTSSVGVLLSGNAFDGTFGLKKIKEKGGITIAQDPETALFKTTPQNAIDAGIIDFTLKPEDIPFQLQKTYQSYKTIDAYTDNEHDLEDESMFHQIINLVFLKTGNDFGHYKQSALRRIIAKRMAVNRKDTIEEYFNLLRNHETEQDHLFHDFLMPVTYFFRDSKSFENLTHVAFPSLVKNVQNNTIRIWVAGCSTGEEAYSVAISIHEYLRQTNNPHIKVQIFASDLSEKSISKARTGMYSHQDVQQIPAHLLQNYFTKTEGNYLINTVIRDMCIFAVHNFVQDPPFSKIDLISCRNTLTYFDSYLQNKILDIFYNSLNENGILFLGESDAALNYDRLFENIDKQEKIYLRSLTTVHDIPERLKDLQCSEPDKNELIHIQDELLDRQEQLLSVRKYTDVIVKTIRQPLVIIDKNFIFKNANPAFYALFKTNETETEGHGFFEIINGQWNISDLKEQILKIKNENIPIKDWKIVIKSADIGQKTLILNARPIENPIEEGAILLAFEDITVAEYTNSQLQAKIRELEKHNDQLECFTLAASEDLQEPLRKMHMFCKRVFENETNLSETGKYNLERVLLSVNSMSQLIEDLIEYSKITFTNKEFKKTELNLILKKTLNDLKNDIKKKNAIITVDPLPLLNAIPNQIQQLFSKIIENSLIYAKEGISPEVKIEIHQSTAEEINEVGGHPECDYVKIGITDNGTGFEKDYERRIFDPFYKIYRKGKCNGSGLGLTLARKIVNNHNGFIKAQGKVNTGAAIFIYLPQ